MVVAVDDELAGVVYSGVVGPEFAHFGHVMKFTFLMFRDLNLEIDNVFPRSFSSPDEIGEGVSGAELFDNSLK